MLPEIFPGSLPARAVSNVVFPLPEGPSMASNSPGRTTPLTPLRRIRFVFDLGEIRPFSSSDGPLIVYAKSSNCTYKNNVRKFMKAMIKKKVFIISKKHIKDAYDLYGASKYKYVIVHGKYPECNWT